MNLTTREDIDAPIAKVYEAVTDFERFERRLMRRGIDVLRDETCPPPNPGAKWRINAEWRGKPYEIDAELISIGVPDGYAMEAHTSGLICVGVVDLVALSKARTRLLVSLDIRATSFSSKLLLQSLRFAKGSIGGRFKARVQEFARELPGEVG